MFQKEVILLKSSLIGLRQFLVTESPLKIMKNAFDFILGALLFSRYLSFCLAFLVECVKTA